MAMKPATPPDYELVASRPDSHAQMGAMAYASLHAVAAGWLFITGVSAAFAAPTRTGGLALAVNGVASLAYTLLASNRLLWSMQSPEATAVRTAIRTAVRSVDWLCTFPPMQVEVLLLLGVHPSGNTLEFALVPTLAALVVGIDLAMRAAFVEMRRAPLLWVTTQLVAAALFVIQLILLTNATPTVAAADRPTTLFFVYLWCAYPVVSFVADGVRWWTVFNTELVEDVLFTLLDVVSKGGLAAYITLRS